ncbi:MAG TPA: outer membrane beta-barrel protein, partial [Polyangiales bacterium]
DKWFANLLYMGGDERPRGDGEKVWRNMFDFVAQYDVLPWWSLAIHADTGWEESNAGNHAWGAGAVYTRFKLADWLYLAGRVDGIYEKVPGDKSVNWILLGGANHVLAATGTVEFRPIGDGFSFRLEYRHDDSDRDVPMYYGSGKNPDGTAKASYYGNTLTLGMTGWF